MLNDTNKNNNSSKKSQENNRGTLVKLRTQKREQRRSLNSSEQTQHATQLAHQITKHPRFLSCKRIACYLTHDGEIDPIYIIEQAWLRDKQVYLPVLHPLKNSLHFAQFDPGTNMRTNKYGIAEPDAPPKDCLKAQQLDLMLVPLVAFDDDNNRLGMGGGFYDRSLAHRNSQQGNNNPYLIGVAHELQKTDKLPVEKWDIRMDAIATEEKIYKNSPDG